MDTPPHHLGLERVVEVFSGHDGLVGLTGSGYAIGADLVLTSGQVARSGTPCHVRPAWSGRWLAAEVVWRGRGGADVVLLRVPEAAWGGLPGIEHNRWGRVAGGDSYRLRCVARGFSRGGSRAVEPGEPWDGPRAEGQSEELGGARGGLRDVERLSGLVSPPTGAVSKALAVSVLSPEADATPVSLWHGMSGAALLAEPAGQLIGVAIPGPGGYARRRLDAVPVTALLSDARFRELAGVPPGPLETVSERDRSVALPALLRPARERLPEDCPDWVLLMARHAVVPFLGRSEELGELRAWAAEPGPLSIAVLSGRGGTGKTRLAGELCEELAEAGWDAGFLPVDAVTGLLSGERVMFEALRPTLVVVDRPEPSSPVVGELVRRLAKHGHNARVRLLLLAREPGDAEWWRRLDTAAGGWLRRLNTTTVQLNAHPLTLAERTEHAVAAMKAFAPSRAVLPSPPHLDDPEYGLPLHVHLAALLRLCDGEDGGESDGVTGEAADRHPDPAAGQATDRHPDGSVGGGLIGRFLARERGQWARVWPDGEERLSEAAARQAVAVLTLTAPAPAELPLLLTCVPGLRTRAPGPPSDTSPLREDSPGDTSPLREDSRGDTPPPHGDSGPASRAGTPDHAPPLHPGALAAARWLSRLFPSSPGPHGGRMAPLGPELVAEQLLAETEDLDALVLAVHDHEGRAVHHLVRMLDVLRLSAGREPVRQALWSLLASRLGKLVAEATANPAGGLGDALNAALVVFAGDRQLAETAAGLQARPGAQEAESPRGAGVPRGAEISVGAEAWEVGLGCRGLTVTLAELAVRHRRGDGGRLALARALTGLSAGLAAVGKTGEAVVAAAEAVETYAGAPPYEEATGRAEALFGLGACLLAGGEAGGAIKPAQEAAARYRILAEEDSSHVEQAARAHYNLACALLELGRLDEAVEAFEAAGGSGGFASQVRGVLSVLPGTAGVTGDVSRPVPLSSFEGIGVDAVLPDLAACLATAVVSAVNNTAPTSRNVAHHLHLAATWLEAHDRPADARAPAAEAVARLRTLAAEEPGLRAMLASAAALLSRLHARSEDLDAAVRSAAEAVRNLRALVTLEPGEHRPALADQLLDLGELLLMDDRPEEALAPLQEAMAVMAERRTAGAARARRLLGLCLDELGRTADALAQLELAAELYDVLCLDGGFSYLAYRDEVRGRLESAQAQRLDRPAEEPWSPLTAPAEEDVDRAERRLVECRSAVEGAGAPGIEQIHAYLSAQATLARLWADTGRAEDGFALAMQAAELLQRHAAPDGPHALAVGMVAAALGRSLVGLGRPKEAIPHLLTAIESYEPHAEASAEFRTELGRLMVMETVALSRAACPSDAEAAADRMVGLYEGLVAERAEPPVALAGALLLQGGIRFTGQRPDGALRSVARALGLVPSPTTRQERRLVGTCLELAGLCLAELHESDAARDRLVAGTAAMAGLGSLPSEPAGVHLLALVRLARMRMEEEGPVAGAALYADVLGLRPLPAPPVIDAVVDELTRFAGEGIRVVGDGARVMEEGTRFAGEGARMAQEIAEGVAGLVGPLAAFTEAMEREVPLSGAPGTYDRFGRCLARLGAAAARAGDTASAETIAELAVRVYRGLTPVSPAYRAPLASALATLATLPSTLPDTQARPGNGAKDGSGPVGLAVLEQAIDLLTQHQARPTDPDRDHVGRLLAGTLHRYAADLLDRGRAVEALAHCERAADLCDELEDPAIAAATYAQLGSTLAALDRPQAALEAIAWSLAELDRAELNRAELDRAEPEERDRTDEAWHETPTAPDPRRVRAQAIQVRGRVLRTSGRAQEATAHLVEALRLFTELKEPLPAAETAALIADDLLAAGRPQEAAEYARTATKGHQPGTVKHALATQRLARCHMMLGELAAANALVEGLIPLARRSPDDLTHRAILADSLAQSSELMPLLRLDGGAEAEARAREAIAIYDELLTTGMNAQALHTSRAGACLTLASALRMRDLAAEAIQPLREAVAALERFSPGNPMQGGLLSRAMLMLGDALMEAGRALEAGLVFHRSTQVTRDELTRAVAHARLGFCQQELGRDDAADAALRVSAALLRELPVAERDLLRDVLAARLKLLERTGRPGDARAVEEELRRLP
ncbi:tetratricopeptide repeat protein [Nonomuraea rubra]|uniref:tetratricopeptide repeat protein n=1 Tax=Nonomuraea rubra TaxID=46180 RepID=UPI003407AAC2